MSDDSHPFRARIRIELEPEFPEILDTSLPAYYGTVKTHHATETAQVTPPSEIEAYAAKYNVENLDVREALLGFAVGTGIVLLIVTPVFLAGAYAVLWPEHAPEFIFQILIASALWYFDFWLARGYWVRKKIVNAQKAAGGEWILNPEERAEHLRKQIKDPEQFREHVRWKLFCDLGKRTGDVHRAIDGALQNIWYERLEREKNLRRQATESAAWQDTKRELAILHTREAKLIDQLALIEQLREDLLLDVGEYAAHAEQVINCPEEALQDVETLRELLMMKYRRLNAVLRGEAILPDIDPDLLEAARGPRAAQKAAAND